MKKARQLMHGMNLVLSEGAFKIQHWIMSGNNVIDEGLELLSTDGKVLGLNWNSREDEFFRVKLQFNKFKDICQSERTTVILEYLEC